MNRSLIRKINKSPHLLGKYFGYSLLTDIHSTWIRDCWLDPEDNSHQAHRNSYKTTAIIVVGAIWWLWNHWDDRTAILRKDFTAASEVLQAIGTILKSDRAHVLFREMYGIDYVILTDSQHTITWNLKSTVTPEGNLNAYGMGEDLTGSHFDRMLVDDFVTIRDRVSKTEREKTKVFIQDIRANIIEPGKPIIFSGTPWHKLDAWTILPEPKKYDVYTAGIEKFTDKFIKYLRSITTPSMFAANYELKHISSEDAIFSDPVYCKWDYDLFPVGHIDAKYSGSHTGAMTMMAMRPDGKVQAVGFMFTNHIIDDYKTIYSYWQKYKCGTTYLELNADKGYAARDLSEMGMITKPYTEKENKFIKIIQNLKTYWHLIEWAEETDPDFISQVMDYQEGQEPDDCPDSASSLIRESGIFKNGSPELSAEEYEDDYKE